eukprot:GFUD01105715.1.p1 GENE.GFUD01105715.1~~GFUD01105715.1.p1  ORF type:complete len:316 (+),score=106.80 GFUD01105715.1:115-1062(+)
MSSSVLTQVLASSVAIADKAGEIVRDIMTKGNLGIVEKTGKDDLQTQADRSAQDCIIASLAKQFPMLTVVGEEGEQDLTGVPAEWIVSVADPEAAKVTCPDMYKDVAMEDLTVWVDPLDGTKEYTQGLLDHVTVLIGIAVGKKSVAGVIHQPYWNYKSTEPNAPIGRTFYGLIGAGVFGFSPISPPVGQRIITTTRSHGTGLVQQALEVLKPSEVLKVGGAGHKVNLLMEGQAHAYVFPSPGCKKWDTCAPEAILHAMGGKLTDMSGRQYEYHSTVEHMNGEGVLATATISDHAWFVENIPQEIKDGVRSSLKKK